MLKTDFKPKKPRKVIFSEKKPRPVVPVLLIVTALALIFWGISSIIQQESAPSSSTIEIAESDTKTEEIVKENDSSIKKFEIDLNLGEPSEPRPASTNPNVVQNQPETESSQKEMLQQELTAPERKWVQTKIKRGDSTAKVFSRHGLSARELYEIMQLGKKTAILEKVQAGHKFEYSTEADGSLYGIRYHIDKLKTLIVIKTGESWSARTDIKPVEVRQANASGVINSSLFLAGKKAGLTDALVMELAGIFGWDVDFILDIRQGDRFTLVYEEKFVEGEKFGNGDILAAEFINQGKSFKAVRFTDSNGSSEYYTPEGLSMRKAFLRAPLDFSYVSSNFNPKRFHPVLKRVKAHRGIDYKAPRGTPIKAAGDGKVIRSAYHKYNGHHVFIQHGQKYVTKYLHLTKRKVKTGQRVKQGQVIGTLGSTGMVTGAHLHYEFLVNGVHRNPRTVKLPDAEPVAKKERQQFFASTEEILRKLDKLTELYQINQATAE